MFKKNILGCEVLCVFLFSTGVSLKGAAAAHKEEGRERGYTAFIKDSRIIFGAQEKSMLPVSQGGIIGDFFQNLGLILNGNCSLQMAFYAQQKNPFISVHWEAPLEAHAFPIEGLNPEYANELCNFCNELLAKKEAFIMFRIMWGKKPEDPIDLIDAWERWSGLILPKKSQPQSK